MFVRRADLSAYDLHLVGVLTNGPAEAYDNHLELSDVEGEFVRAAHEVYENLSLAYDRELAPWEKICEEASCELIGALHSSIEAEVVHYSGEEDRSEEDHFFVIAEFEGIKWLVDSTYLQFLEIENRSEASASPVMIIPITDDRECFEEELSGWGISEENYHIWTNMIFDEQN